jgi:hypothetical protein
MQEALNTPPIAADIRKPFLVARRVTASLLVEQCNSRAQCSTRSGLYFVARVVLAAVGPFLAGTSIAKQKPRPG